MPITRDYSWRPQQGATAGRHNQRQKWATTPAADFKIDSSRSPPHVPKNGTKHCHRWRVQRDFITGAHSGIETKHHYTTTLPHDDSTILKSSPPQRRRTTTAPRIQKASPAQPPPPPPTPTTPHPTMPPAPHEQTTAYPTPHRGTRTHGRNTAAPPQYRLINCLACYTEARHALPQPRSKTYVSEYLEPGNPKLQDVARNTVA